MVYWKMQRSKKESEDNQEGIEKWDRKYKDGIKNLCHSLFAGISYFNQNKTGGNGGMHT